MKNSVVRRLYAYRFFDDFVLIYPLYQVLFAENGLNISQISLLFIIWSVVSLVAEVPSGVLADRYSRKNLLALGQAIRAAGYVFWLVMPNFWGYAIGFGLWGIGSAFDSGTYQALLYDELKANKAEGIYVKVQGRAQSFSLAGNFLATALAAGAVLLGYPVLLLASAGAVVVAGMIAWTLPNVKPQEEVADTGYISELVDGVKESFKTPTILVIIMLSAMITSIFGSLEEYSPLFFHDLQWSHSAVSLGQASVVLLTVIASVIAYKFERLTVGWFLALLSVSGLCLAALGLDSIRLAAPLFVGLFFFVSKLLETIFDGKLQHNINSHRRATITSVSGFVAEVVGLLIYAVFGPLADNSGTIAAFWWFGIAIACIGAIYLVMHWRTRIFRSLNTATK